jgi:hypothetical protein
MEVPASLFRPAPLLFCTPWPVRALARSETVPIPPSDQNVAQPLARRRPVPRAAAGCAAVNALLSRVPRRAFQAGRDVVGSRNCRRNDVSLRCVQRDGPMHCGRWDDSANPAHRASTAGRTLVIVPCDLVAMAIVSVDRRGKACSQCGQVNMDSRIRVAVEVS